jgi:hypothetical protein
MTTILTQATPTALWFNAIQGVETQRQVTLKTEVEAYLVFLLMRYTRDTALAQETLALKFLRGLQATPHLRAETLQAVGDQCLIISGLFPLIAERRQLKLKYFVELGQVTYNGLSTHNNDLFSLLSKQFIILTDLLHAFRPE